ncbi:type II toxin-antitoxin system Phd/YefM family antitoxin [Streptomyces sp. B3I8]|uniref:type II toxin-antitoxin system Phd/YefM family antitoxin n=1 Tax=Streptomyces sp. B3I8 TaxID=3042303 RepID=UPI002787394E|nr:type II toxin-antitoxin system prevent-host-death family antitoxin [Streptomyces sp. B3I8]MDQ0788880.1 antitoxin YefM [Streptomyces sp. B3I8]
MSITASEARRRLFPLIDEVNSDRTAIEIVSKNGSAYLVSAAEYEALEETAHLLRSPANARRLLRSYQSALDGEYEHRELIRNDEDDESTESS